MNFIINSLKNISQRFLTSATAMDNIPKFVGLDNEKTINFLKLGEAKPNIQLKKVMTIPEEKWKHFLNLFVKSGTKERLFSAITEMLWIEFLNF
jgi:hypothetical protein